MCSVSLENLTCLSPLWAECWNPTEDSLRRASLLLEDENTGVQIRIDIGDLLFGYPMSASAQLILPYLVVYKLNLQGRSLVLVQRDLTYLPECP